MADPFRYFRIEAAELLEQMQSGVLELEKSAEPARVVVRLLRAAHTLKGAARVVRQPAIADVAHAIEDTLLPFREGAPPTAPAIDAVLAQLDDIRRLLSALPTAEGSSAPAPVTLAARPVPEASAPEIASRTALAETNVEVRLVRAEASDLDAVMEGALELGTQFELIRRTGSELERSRKLLELLSEKLEKSRVAGAGRAGFAALTAMADELGAELSRVGRELEGGLDQAGRELGQLRDDVERLRLVRAGVLGSAFERTVRDAAQVLDKKVRFEMRGGDVRVDADLAVHAQRALVQAVRNAVAHGVESPAERRRLGKPEEGSVTITVTRRGQEIVFECSDDGRGLDIEAIRRNLRNKGVERVAELSEDALVALLTRGGVSTSETVTGVSGRGIGLDLIREVAERLGGRLEITHRVGQGLTLALGVKATVAAVDVLLVEIEAGVFAVPLDAVSWTVRCNDADTTRDGTRRVLLVEGELVPFVPLASVLEGVRSARVGSRTWDVFVVKHHDERVAFGVDRLLGVENIVVRQLPDLAPAAPSVLAVALAPDGSARVVLNTEELVRGARHVGAQPAELEAKVFKILVIDDSLTTRMLEQSILESAGYDVDTATSAEEGLEKAQAQDYALFLVDVEMPGMNGFSFIETIRADARLHAVPAVLVTSLNSPEDFERGRAVGASGYIVKSEFDQIDLLDRIHRLVTGE